MKRHKSKELIEAERTILRALRASQREDYRQRRGKPHRRLLLNLLTLAIIVGITLVSAAPLAWMSRDMAFWLGMPLCSAIFFVLFFKAEKWLAPIADRILPEWRND